MTGKGDSDSTHSSFIVLGVILVILVINAIVGVMQESGAEEAIEKGFDREFSLGVIRQGLDREFSLGLNLLTTS